MLAATASAVTDSHAIDVCDLEKRFLSEQIPVFKNVNFTVPRGQRVALIGANGSGKSTLLRCCARLLQPDRGRICLHGVDLTTVAGHSLRRARARIGFVFQQHQLAPRLTVLSNVLHGSLGRGTGPRHWCHALAKRIDRERAMECLTQVGLAHLATRRCDRLSGGQAQRVAIARALMQSPEIIFADEPAASLDPNAGEQIMALFSELTQSSKITLLFVSHELQHALTYSERILGLHQQQLLLDVESAHESIGSLRRWYS